MSQDSLPISLVVRVWRIVGTSRDVLRRRSAGELGESWASQDSPLILPLILPVAAVKRKVGCRILTDALALRWLSFQHTLATKCLRPNALSQNGFEKTFF